MEGREAEVQEKAKGENLLGMENTEKVRFHLSKSMWYACLWSSTGKRNAEETNQADE